MTLETGNGAHRARAREPSEPDVLSAITSERAKTLLVEAPAQAQAEALAILRDHPDNPGALLLLGAALQRQGEAAAATIVLGALSQSEPQMASAHFELGLAFGRIGESDNAIAALSRAVDLDPDFMDAWTALGDQLAAGAFAKYESGPGPVEAAADPQFLAAERAYRSELFGEAEELLRGIMASRPQDVDAVKLLANTVLRTGRRSDAEALLCRCLELDPRDTSMRFRYATVLLGQGKWPKAIAQLDELLRHNRINALCRNVKAAGLARIGEFALAAAEFEALLNDHPGQPGAWLAYGQALRAVGRGDECVRAFRKAIELVPAFGDAWSSLAAVKTFRFSVAEIDALRTLISRSEVMGKNRGQLHFALGKALEDAGEYRESFQNFRRGNVLIRSSIVYDADGFTDLGKRTRSLFTAGFLRDRAGSGCETGEPIFIVGMPRSGSTLVEQILSTHTAIEGTTELHAIISLADGLVDRSKIAEGGVRYPEVLSALDARRLTSLGEDYLNLVRRHRKLRRPFFTDKMPRNFVHAGFIHAILPNARIIDVRRHPLACCFSCYKSYFPFGQHFSYSLGDLARYYSDYVELMAHFDNVMPGTIHRVIYEDLIADPEAEMRRLFVHLNLPFEERCMQFYTNDRVVRTMSTEQVRMPVYTEGLQHWRNYEPWMEPLKAGLGYIVDAYPAVPQFFPRLHADLSIVTRQPFESHHAEIRHGG